MLHMAQFNAGDTQTESRSQRDTSVSTLSKCRFREYFDSLHQHCLLVLTYSSFCPKYKGTVSLTSLFALLSQSAFIMSKFPYQELSFCAAFIIRYDMKKCIYLYLRSVYISSPFQRKFLALETATSHSHFHHILLAKTPVIYQQTNMTTTTTQISQDIAKPKQFDIYAYQMSLIPGGPFQSLGKDMVRIYIFIFCMQLCIAVYWFLGG